MEAEKTDNTLLKKIFSLLESIQDSPLTDKEIKEKSVRLAGYIVDAGASVAKSLDKKETGFFSKMAQDVNAKNLLASIIDQTFRPVSEKRMANQFAHLLFQYGIPKSFPFVHRAFFFLFKLFGCKAPTIFIPIFKKLLSNSLHYIIKPSKGPFLEAYLKEKKNLSIAPYLVGNRSSGEKDSLKKLEDYIGLLKNPNIQAISVKTSHLYSQFHLFNWEKSREVTLERLREIFREALPKDKKNHGKFVNIYMEHYPTFQFNIDLFKTLLEEEEFYHLQAGCTLQAYLPESYKTQKELTKWAKERVEKGRAPITLTIVKGSHLTFEAVIASQNNWAQAAYLTKVETDANFKKMIRYGLDKDLLKCCHLTVGTHNIFDISYALVLLSSKNIHKNVYFAMLEGRTTYNRKVLEKIIPKKLVIAPTLFTKERPVEAITYYLERLNDGSGEETFLFHAYNLTSNSKGFETLSDLYLQSINEMDKISNEKRRDSLRKETPDKRLPFRIFENDGQTDFISPENRKWGNQIIEKWSLFKDITIPLVIGGKEIITENITSTHDFTDPSKALYHYCLADENAIEQALFQANDYQKKWAQTSFEERLAIMKQVAVVYRKHRADLIGLLMADGAKTLVDADEEVSEAIDTIEYYRLRMHKLLKMKDIEWSPRGVALIISSRGFPCTISTGGIASNLLSGNTVIFKPPPESVLTGWHLVNAFWEAGIPKEAIQFLPCQDELVENKLIVDPRLSLMILGSKTVTAKRFIKKNPSLQIEAATEGKNCMIVSDVADLGQAAEAIIESAFGYSGQKKSSLAIAILLEDVYNNPEFLQHLADATKSLPIGSVWDKETRIVPLIQKPDEEVYHALTTLNEGEEWLLKPQQDPHNSHLWSPGIKMGIQRGSFSHTHMIPAPLLSLMKAKDFDEALEIANDTPFGLTASIYSLDRREQVTWESKIEAGNLYINRDMTHAVIRLHPYGGCKESSFGKGFKAGGPNFLTACMKASQKELPREKQPVSVEVNNFTSFIEQIDMTAEELGIWYASVANYSYWWKRMKQKRDPSKLFGEDNFFGYIPRKKMALRITPTSSPIDVLRVCAAAMTSEAELIVSWCSQHTQDLNWQMLSPLIRVIDEPERIFLEKVEEGKFKKIRMVETPSDELFSAASKSATFICSDPVLADGRLELLHYIRELSLSYIFHRCGYLGVRESEMRKPIL